MRLFGRAKKEKWGEKTRVTYFLETDKQLRDLTVIRYVDASVQAAVEESRDHVLTLAKEMLKQVAEQFVRWWVRTRMAKFSNHMTNPTLLLDQRCGPKRVARPHPPNRPRPQSIPTLKIATAQELTRASLGFRCPFPCGMRRSFRRERERRACRVNPMRTFRERPGGLSCLDR